MKRQWHTVIARLDALGRRDRMTLLAGAIAALIGLEFTLVQPMAAKRKMMLLAVQADAEAQSDALTAERSARAQQLATARQRMAELQGQLSRLGLQASTRAALSAFLVQLGKQGVAIAGVRGLAVEPLTITPPGAEAAAPPNPSASAAATLYRHRTELVLQGPVAGLTQAINGLERDMAPLRIERVQVAPNTAGELRATVVLTAITPERTWIAF
jgi:hypothetical protein